MEVNGEVIEAELQKCITPAMYTSFYQDTQNRINVKSLMHKIEENKGIFHDLLRKGISRESKVKLPE